MSLVHLKLKQTKIDDSFVEYDVESIDFNQEMEWEIIGKIVIDKAGKKYNFTVCDRYKDKKIVPPFLYSKSEDERKVLLDTKYKGFGYGAWSLRIDHWINSLIEQDIFPTNYP